MRLILFIILFSLSAMASFEIPKNLNESDRIGVLKLLGPGSAHRSLSAQYPLGGYSGVEVGIARHYIAIADLRGLGDGSNSEDNISFPIVTFGKGLFYDVDFFLSFVPFSQSDSVQNTSFQGRWSFFQSEDWPIYLGASINGSNSNFKNCLSILNYGFDLFLNFKSQNLSLYFGVGSLFSTGQFVGGAQGVTDTGKSESNNITSAHSMIGADLQFGPWFIVGELDRYFDSYYSLKVGYRF